MIFQQGCPPRLSRGELGFVAFHGSLGKTDPPPDPSRLSQHLKNNSPLHPRRMLTATAQPVFRPGGRLGFFLRMETMQ